MTRDWMLTAPKAAPGLGPLAANAMGFAGILSLAEHPTWTLWTF
jgi:hypothetical protein